MPTSYLSAEQLTPGAAVVVVRSGHLVVGRYVEWFVAYGKPKVRVPTQRAPDGENMPKDVLRLATAEEVASAAIFTASFVAGNTNVIPGSIGVSGGTAPVAAVPAAETAPLALDSIEATPAAVSPVPAAPAPARLASLAPAYSVTQRFSFLSRLVDMIGSGYATALIVTGPGGLGKSYEVKTRLLSTGLKQGDDFVIIKGFSTPKSLFRTLYENNGKVIVFDDCDAVLEHESALNVLKGALDGYDDRWVSWLTERPDETLPSQFEFTGRAIFISNRTSSEIDQPILSRSLHVDVTMTTAEKLERLEQLLASLKPDVPADAKREALDLIVEHAAHAKDLNIRTLLKVIDCRVAFPDNWRDLAAYAITSG